MARKLKNKNLEQAHLLKEYASWIYCDNCNNTVAYLCYVTYDLCDFNFICNCGSHGKVHLEFETNQPKIKNHHSLMELKNRLCCPEDHSPLITFVEKNLKEYQCEMVCHSCRNSYSIFKQKVRNI